MNSLSLFKQFFYQSRVPQIVSYKDSMELEANDAFYEFIGYKKEEWRTLTVEDVSHPEDYHLDFQLYLEILNGMRKEYQIEKRYIHKSGLILWGLLHVSKIEDPHTGECCLLAQVMDITEKKEMEHSLRQSETKYRLLAEHSSDMINLHAVDGTFLYVSPSVKTILGYNPYELVGKSPYDYIHPEDRFSVNKVHEQLLRNGNNGLFTYRIKTKVGEYVWIETAVKAVINEHTKVVSELITVSRDIQQRKMTDEMLRKSEKLAIVGQLAAAVAHEIRNPLTSIKGFVQLFSLDKESISNKYLEIVLTELNRVEEIITEFLVMAKPHHEKRKSIFVDQIVEQVVQLLESQALFSNKEIVVDVKSTISSIDGDPNALKQVFLNIIQNGLDAIQSKGTIYIEITQCEQNISISIMDNGIGIPKQRIGKLGEPFYSTKEKGTGLGLMTSYRIVEQHNGTLEVHSEEAKGTTVTVKLPVWRNETPF
ncbi:PAS domain S-box protein [Bacillus salitolerans]|uniref:histidine kinase n=1 Tax=Bacillus salitolerans TaxID=1437434 RepID=A0ABW4LPT6_9BACI